jgi:hypothetical protein
LKWDKSVKLALSAPSLILLCARLNPVAARAGLVARRVAGGLGAQHAPHQIGDVDAGKRRLDHKRRIETSRQQAYRQVGRRKMPLERLIDVVHEMAQPSRGRQSRQVSPSSRQ